MTYRLFGFLPMPDDLCNCEIVMYDEHDDVFVSTIAADNSDLLRTVIGHPIYSWLVVAEVYVDLDSAKTGHKKWVSIATKSKLPDDLIDKHNVVGLVYNLISECKEE